MPVWTIYVAHQKDVRLGNWGTARKWKKFEENKKVRQDSPPEFTATIEYDPSISFNDFIRFDRDGTPEWVGFVEDIQVAWDQSGRFHDLAGRDLTFLLWRKYVENFNNAISQTGGFFGNVNAVELIKFLLRTPRSDLPEVEDDSLGQFSIYPFNKEGWGIDVSNFTGITSGGHVSTDDSDRGYGDVGTAVLRKRDMVWGNSGSPNQASNQTTEGQVNGVVSCGWETHGSSPYINDGNTSKNPTNYIKSHININDTAIFTQNGLNPADNATGINSCYLSILGASDGSWGWWNTSNCFVYVWVESIGLWASIGNFGGRSAASALGNISNLNWRSLTFNCTNIITNISDLQNAQLKFVETGSLSTFIQYAFFSVGFNGTGSIQQGEWVNIQFNPIECMGVYIESRASIDQFPQNYHITTKGPTEVFSGYSEVDTGNYIQLNAGQDTISFTSWQSNNPSKIAYFYRHGINSNNTGPIGDFEESFAFNIASSQSCTIAPPIGDNLPPAFVPWCLANQIADYSVIRNGTGNFTALEIINVNNVLSIQTIEQTGGSSISDNATVISTNTAYFVQVSRVGSTLTYSVFTQQTMTPASRVYTHTFSTAATYTYHYQAITYNQVPLYGTIYSNDMDIWVVGGERMVNGGFETGSSTGWLLYNSVVQSDSGAYSGGYDLYMPCTASSTPPYTPETCEASQSANFNPAVIKSTCTALGFWHKGEVTNKHFQYYLTYSDNTTSAFIDVFTQNYWVFENALANAWSDSSKRVTNLWIDTAGIDSYALYLDAFTCQVSTTNTWDAYGGSAQVITNTTKQIQGSGCQQIHCTSNGQGHYWEKNLPNPISTLRTDAWVRCPPPAQTTTNTDVKVNTTNGWNTSGSNHWGVYGQYPYVRNNNNEDNNHIYVLGSQILSFDSNVTDFCTFDTLNNSFSPAKTFFSVTATNNCSMNVSGRIVNNIGGTGSLQNLHIKAYLWVQHMNNGAGAWVQIGDSGTFVFVPTLLNPNAMAWTNVFAPIQVNSYLSSMFDWDSAKVKFSFYGSVQSTGDLSKTQFQIGQVKLHWDGIGSQGYVSLLKVHNSSAGVDPASAYIAQVVVAPSEWATDNQNYMRFMIRGLNGLPVAQNGQWGAGWTELVVPNGHLDSPSPWVKIGLYVNVGSGNGYIKLYNITNWDGVTLDANNFPADGAYLLCQLTGLTNNSTGLIERVDYEAEYESNYGNSSTYDTFLDLITMYTFNTETYTVGTIFAGEGPEITLVTVTDNQYPDMIHSWCAQTISNIKIIVDDAEPTHGWEVTQIYVYETDIPKFRVVLDSCTPYPDEYKLSFNPSGYVDTVDTDIGLEVYHNSYDGTIGPNYVGTLLDDDDDTMEWRVDVTGGHYKPQAGDTIILATHDGGLGSGTGTLISAALSVYSGGPYIYLSDANIDLSIFDSQELFWIGPANIPKNRLSDVLWDIAVLVNDNYVPFEWWIEYPSVGDPTRCIGDFHMGPRRGSDMSGTVSFVTGTNMEDVTYQKSSRDTYQRCQIVGQGEGKNQDDTSSFWQNDQDAMDETQGFIEDIVTQKQVTGGRIANRYAKVQLKLDASPKRKNAITCNVGRDTYDSGTYDCGDDVTITDVLTGLDDSFRIWNSKVNGDSNGEHVQLVVQAPYLDINNIWKGVYKQLKNLGAVGVIAQDWSGDGTSADKVSASKLSDLFSVSAKNDTIDVGVGATDPKWFGPNNEGHGAGWSSTSGNISIHGGNSQGGLVWVEARYNSQYDVSGAKLTSDTVDIPMSQEPKFSTDFKIYQGYNQAHSEYDIWNTDDYVDFGMFNHDYFNGINPNGNGVGFVIRVICEGVGIYNAYAIFCWEVGDSGLTTAQLEAAGKAKFICGLEPNVKYKAMIEVEYNSGNYGNALPEVMISIANEEVTNPPTYYVVWTQFNTVAMLSASSFFNYMTIRPIYVFAFGYAPTGHRCQMFFYSLKCQRNVVTT